MNITGAESSKANASLRRSEDPHIFETALLAARLAALDAFLREICPRAPTEAEIAVMRERKAVKN